MYLKVSNLEITIVVDCPWDSESNEIFKKVKFLTLYQQLN